MKKKIFLLSALCLLEVQWSMAQAPKWVDKAKRAVFSVITYGENDKILNTGNGFFVTEDGVALSDCSLFEGAQRAVVVNSEGVQMPVVSIMGANDMYDVIKFRVGISTKKVPAYYTLNLRLKDKMVSCPVMTEEGQVFALAQKSSGADTATICYAVDADFAMEQNVSAFSFSDMTLKNIGIKKALRTAMCAVPPTGYTAPRMMPRWIRSWRIWIKP